MKPWELDRLTPVELNEMIEAWNMAQGGVEKERPMPSELGRRATQAMQLLRERRG